MEKETDYNGYTNYETWLFALNVDNEQGLQEISRQIIKRYDYKEPHEIAQILKDWAEETFWVDDTGVYKICDVWDSRSWGKIDWDDIAETWINEY